MNIDAIGILVVISFGILNTCGVIYIAKSFLFFSWKMTDLQIQIKEAEEEN